MAVVFQVLLGVAAVASAVWAGTLLAHPAMNVPRSQHDKLSPEGRRRVSTSWPFAVWVLLALLSGGLTWPEVPSLLRVLIFGALPALAAFVVARAVRARAS